MQRLAVSVLVTLVLAGCATDAPDADPATGSLAPDGVLPLGDGQVTTTPQVGAVMSCQSTFHGGGAQGTGPWIQGDVWYPDQKTVVVDGSVSWDRSFTTNLGTGTRTVTGNGLPDHATGTYPVGASDDAYAYDRNPNTIRQTPLEWDLPADPQAAASPSCLSMGAIGVLLTGAVFFNGLDAEGRDAVAHEIQDACHGHTHTVPWDGALTDIYHYHATTEYPYTLGCYVGTPV